MQEKLEEVIEDGDQLFIFSHLINFYQPFKENDLEQSIELQIIYPSELELEFTDKLIYEEELERDQKDEFKVDGSVRKLLKSGKDIDNALIAVVIQSLKIVQEMRNLNRSYNSRQKFWQYLMGVNL